jgi:hypothetical protein
MEQSTHDKSRPQYEEPGTQEMKAREPFQHEGQGAQDRSTPQHEEQGMQEQFMSAMLKRNPPT